MSKIHVINEAGERIGSEFSNILSAAIWCNAEGYAHPMLSHNRYHVRGPVTFACPVPVAATPAEAITLACKKAHAKPGNVQKVKVLK